MLMIDELMYKSGDLFERCVGMDTIYASEGRCEKRITLSALFSFPYADMIRLRQWNEDNAIGCRNIVVFNIYKSRGCLLTYNNLYATFLTHFLNKYDFVNTKCFYISFQNLVTVKRNVIFYGREHKNEYSHPHKFIYNSFVIFPHISLECFLYPNVIQKLRFIR